MKQLSYGAGYSLTPSNQPNSILNHLQDLTATPNATNNIDYFYSAVINGKTITRVH